MSSKHHKTKSSYFLRTQSRILNGENLTPFNAFNSFNSYMSIAQKKNKHKNKTSSKNKKKDSKKIFNNSLTGNKQTKIKKFINDIEPSSYRGIDLNKVSGSSHSPNKLNISTKNFQQKKHYTNGDKNIGNKNNNEINEKQNVLLDEYNYIKKPYSEKIYLDNSYNLNNNNINSNNEKNIYNVNQICSKYKNDFYLRHNDIPINNNKYDENYHLNKDIILKKEYIESYKNKNKIINNNFDQQYQNSLPSNIPENEILNYPGESMSITNMDNFIKKNNNYLNKNSINETKRNSKKNDIYYKINKLKNEIECSNINKPNNDTQLTYNYNGNNFNTNLANINKENYSNNIINKLENSTNNYNFTYQINNKMNNDCELNENKTKIGLNTCSNNDFFLLNNKQYNQYNEIYAKNNEILSNKIFINSLSDFNSTNNFMRSFSPKNRLYNRNFTNENLYFDYDNTYNPKNYSEAHDFFGIHMNGNRLEQLLKTIPRHKKENQIQKYNNNIYALSKLNKEKENEKKNVNKSFNNICILNNDKNYNEEIDNVMPPNIINYD